MIFIEPIFQDLRYGVRTLCRNVGFTTVAVLALALGIGVGTVALTVYRAFFDRPLDAHNPSEMVNLALIRRSGGIDPYFSYADYAAYQKHVHSFAGLIAAGVNFEHVNLLGAGGAVSQRSSADGSLAGRLGLLSASASNKEFASAAIVTENYFSVLGVSALRGRTFKVDDTPGLAASPSVLISENYWQKKFAGDAEVLGRTLRLNGVAVTVIGITPHDFAGTDFAVPDLWVPMSLQPLFHAGDDPLRDRESPCCRLFARLAPGASIVQAQAEMSLLAAHLHAPDDALDLGRVDSVLLWPGSPAHSPVKMNAGFNYSILLIVIAVGMVLAIACANVASLQLARTASRQKELQTRLSLGASRLRLIQQLLTESVLLGVLAGIVAFLFTWALLKVLEVLAAEAFPAGYGTMILRVTPDLKIFASVCVISLIAGILVGLAPALDSSHSAFSPASKINAKVLPSRARQLRDAFIVAQVAVTLALMIAGSMLIRSSIHALNMDTGYDGKRVVALDLQFPEGAKYSADREKSIVNDLRTRLAALPGVAAVTSARPPLSDGIRWSAVSLNGEEPSTKNTRATVYYSYVQANYFRTLGIPLVLGRTFPSQGRDPEPFAIVSESAAKRLWSGQNPIGRGLRLGTGSSHQKGEIVPDGPVFQVIGVVRDTSWLTFGSGDPEVYVPLPEERIQDYPLLIRTEFDPKPLVAAIGPVVSAVDPDVEAHFTTLEEMLRLTPVFAIPSIAAAIASTVALLGLMLASMGIYSTVSYIVVIRTREVGVRMALGAQKGDILGLMLRAGTRPVLAGLLIGVFLAGAASYLLRSVLYGLGPVDGISFFGVSVLFLAIALLAAYVPSRRAMQVEPIVALRYE